MGRNRFKKTIPSWRLQENNNPSLNRGRPWKYNIKCSEAWKNEVKKIEIEKENKELYTTHAEIK